MAPNQDPGTRAAAPVLPLVPLGAGVGVGLTTLFLPPPTPPPPPVPPPLPLPAPMPANRNREGRRVWRTTEGRGETRSEHTLSWKRMRQVRRGARFPRRGRGKRASSEENGRGFPPRKTRKQEIGPRTKSATGAQPQPCSCTRSGLERAQGTVRRDHMAPEPGTFIDDF